MRSNIFTTLRRRFTNKQSDVARARIWSNEQLSQVAREFRGSVINVSAWKDSDKHGKRYRDYFINASGYATSNFSTYRGGEALAESDHEIDLSAPLADELIGKYDVVFNHTTLEHVFDFQQAFKNMVDLSSGSLIIVVPFVQQMHGPEDGDFWRFTPYAMRRLFSNNKMNVLYEACGPKSSKVRYLFYVGTKGKANYNNELFVGENATAIEAARSGKFF